LQRQKEREKIEINAIVKEERHRNEEDRHMKIKTEQKYMHDNWTLLQQTHRHSRAAPAIDQAKLHLPEQAQRYAVGDEAGAGREKEVVLERGKTHFR